MKLKDLCVCPLPPCMRRCVPRSYDRLQRQRALSLSPASAKKLVDSPDPRQHGIRQSIGEPYPQESSHRAAVDLTTSEYTNL